MDLGNPNLDPIIKTGWEQCYCKDNQILIPITIHGLKSELKRLRYWENREKHTSTLSRVITFDLIVRILISLVFWKLDIYSFLGTPRSPQSKSRKTSKCMFKRKIEKVQEDKIANINHAQPGPPKRAVGAPCRCAWPRKVCQGLQKAPGNSELKN